jgi:transposase InsO family protein
MSDKHSIKDMCAALCVSRSGYYQWKNAGESPRAHQTDRLKRLIENEYAKSRQTYGSPRITRALRNGGATAGYNRIARLMRSAGLLGRQKRRYRMRTTDSRHDPPFAPNHLAMAPTPTKPEQIWPTDITYIETDEGWLYLAGVLDLYSRRLIGWAMGQAVNLPAISRTEHGVEATSACRPGAVPFRPWMPIRQRNLSAGSGCERLHGFHESQW